MKTLRYNTGASQTWGFNLFRNIRHKNEQVYLTAIPRGFDIYRVSLAAKITGLDLPARRDIKLIPYSLGSVNKDFTRTAGDKVDEKADVGLDVKWGIRPNLTLDATINTDFAQVEADEEQVNLTRFDLFFPEKRPFFLENASTFQFGNPQNIDLFFSRRDRPVGHRRAHRYHGGRAVERQSGRLERRPPEHSDRRRQRCHSAPEWSGRPTTSAWSACSARSAGRATAPSSSTARARAATPWTRIGTEPMASTRTSRSPRTSECRPSWPGRTPRRIAPSVRKGSDYSGRAFYNFTNNLWQISGGYSQVGDNFNPEVGFLPRRGYRRPEFRTFFQPQPKKHRRGFADYAPHVTYNSYWGFDDKLQSEAWHIHPLEIQPKQGGRFGWFANYNKDNPAAPFTVYNRDGKRVVIPAGKYDWWQSVFEYLHNPSARVTGTFRFYSGHYYNGDFLATEFTSEYRITPKATASIGWTRQDIKLPGGSFINHLVPIKASYAFTTLANLSALLQYNSQTGQFTSNVRLAFLNRSGTGLFIVFNDRRDRLSSTPQETLGRSFVVKYTKLFDF